MPVYNPRDMEYCWACAESDDKMSKPKNNLVIGRGSKKLGAK
jgi:hypothetical protein